MKKAQPLRAMQKLHFLENDYNGNLCCEKKRKKQYSIHKRNSAATECLTKIDYKTAFSQLEDGLENNSLTT